MTITFGPNLGLMDGAADGEAHASDMRKFLRGVDGLVQTRALTIGTNTPPGSPANGDIHVIGTAPTGAWATHANKVARYRTIDTAGWDFFTPKEGWRVAVVGGVGDYRYSGSAWIALLDGVAALSKGYIDGLEMEWVSGTSLRVTTGTAYVEGSARYVNAAAAITKSSLVLSANTWYHVYLYLNAGTPDIEIVTTAPAAPYSGTARSKTGDSSRRYLGSVRSNASSQLRNFTQSGGFVHWALNEGFVLGNGTASASTAVSCAAGAPVTASAAHITVGNDDNTQAVRITSGPGAVASPTVFSFLLPARQNLSPWVALNSNQEIFYAYDAAPGVGTYISVLSYQFER